jgi:hypothetical protein
LFESIEEIGTDGKTDRGDGHRVLGRSGEWGAVSREYYRIFILDCPILYQ